MAQLVKHLPGKHEALSMIPRPHIKMLGVVVHTGDPSAEEVERGESLSPLASQPILLMEFQDSERPWRETVSEKVHDRPKDDP